MKVIFVKKTKFEISFLILILSGIISTSILLEYESNMSEVYFNATNEDLLFPKFSYFNNSASTIFINGSDTRPGAPNWAWAENEDWCTKIDNVYYIENLTINGNDISSCIKIINSDVNLIIRNCTILNSSKGNDAEFTGGIELFNVNNSQILNNDISNNNGYGISISSEIPKLQNNNTISNNKISNNSISGVLLSYCEQSNITENNILRNGNGIKVLGSKNITIASNNASYNENDINHKPENGVGIYVYNSYNITIINNNATSNLYDGIYLQGVIEDTFISGNKMIGCGLKLEYNTLSNALTNNVDNTNTVNSKTLYCKENEIGLTEADFTDPGQIILIDCSDSIISEIDVNSSSIGISLLFCSNISIIKGIFSNNNRFGIYLMGSYDNIVVNNSITYNLQSGILLKNSYSNQIIGNNVFNNDQIGVAIDINSDWNDIYSNCFGGNNLCNAVDNGTNNEWDNGVKGNFWDDYTGIDANNNNIGDSAYSINGTALSRDNYPLIYCGAEPIPGPSNQPGGFIFGYNLVIYLGMISLISVIVMRKWQLNSK